MGSHGAFYTLHSSGHKKYTISYNEANIGPRNVSGNQIQYGPKGGSYVIHNGKKVYNIKPVFKQPILNKVKKMVAGAVIGKTLVKYVKTKKQPSLNKVKKTVAGAVIGKTVAKYIQSKKPATNKKGTPLVKTSHGKYYKMSKTGKSKIYVKNVIQPPQFTLKPKKTVLQYTNEQKKAAGEKIAHFVTTRFYDKLLGIALSRQKYKWDKISREVTGEFEPFNPGAYENPAKYKKASMYRKAILRYMRLHKWPNGIWRGLGEHEVDKIDGKVGQVIKAKSFSQFSRSRTIAEGFARRSTILGDAKVILHIGNNVAVPAVQYYGEDSKGNIKLKKLFNKYENENEVLLPPGDFIVKDIKPAFGYSILEVDFKPDYNPTERLLYDSMNKKYKEVYPSSIKTKEYQSPVLHPTRNSKGFVNEPVWHH
jgi:hypothetical protein